MMHLDYRFCPNWTTAGCGCPQPPLEQYGVVVPPAPSGPSFAGRVAKLERGLNAYLCGDSIDLNKQTLETMREVCEVIREQQAALAAIVDLDDGDKPDLWHFETEFDAARAVLAKWRIE